MTCITIIPGFAMQLLELNYVSAVNRDEITSENEFQIRDYLIKLEDYSCKSYAD